MQSSVPALFFWKSQKTEQDILKGVYYALVLTIRNPGKSTKFFNNESGHTLFDKLKGISSEMVTFDRFLAVVGFFRSSGYFKLRKELGDISEIKILVGINIDDIFRKYNKALLMLADEEKAKAI